MLAKGIQQQVHAYRGGHELVASSVRLSPIDQDVIDRLSDLAGPIGPGERFDPYLTLYPLPSGRYYVVARTWQDLGAPRAGCVVTRSSLIPQEIWTKESLLISSVVEELEQHNIGDLRVPIDGLATLPPLPSTLPSITGSSLRELVEALFLESRQPIVVIGAQSPELTVVRLLGALWPAMRRSMALCTHAFSPRSIDGRPFDLLFAPTSARQNYGHWQGRRIEGESSFKARHRWTEEITERTFGGSLPQPLLLPFGHFSADSDGADEAVFRLYLLWSELEQRSKSSPLAVLGMLDIVSSRRTEGEAGVVALLPILRHSLSMAAANLSTGDLLSYIQTLLGKFPSRLPPTNLLREIRRHAALAAHAAPEEAFAHLAKCGAAGEVLPAVIVAGIGDGLAASTQGSEYVDKVLGLGREACQQLLSYSKRFCESVVTALEAAGDASKFVALAGLLETRDALRRARARRNLLRTFRSPLEVPVLRVLLASATAAALTSAVKALWLGNGLSVKEFDPVLRDAADDRYKLNALRTAIASLPSSPDTDRAVLSNLSLCAPDIEWISGFPANPSRKSSWCDEVVQRAADWELRSLPGKFTDVLLSMLAGESCDHVSSLARVFIQASGASSGRLGMVDGLIPIVDAPTANQLAVIGLEHVLSDESRVGEERAAAFFSAHATRVPARDLVALLANGRLGTERVSANLSVALSSSLESQRHVASRADDLTDLLVRRRGLVPSQEAIGAWSLFIALAREASPATELRAASSALDYALNLRHLQVSPLILTCFPVVYEELRQSRSTPSLFSYFTFVDWDRCRTARYDLVDAFLESAWPPADLILVADRIGEVHAIVQILAQRQRGRRYLESILASTSNLPVHLLTQLRDEVSRARSADS